MSFNLKSQWMLWLVMVAVVLGGVTVVELSSAKLVTLQLHLGKSVVLNVFRPIPHTLDLTSRFNRENWKDKRPELGDFQTKGGTRQETATLEFTNPGAPIKLLVQCEENKAVYEALPAGSYNANSKWRDFVPFVDDGNPNRVPWPPNGSSRLFLPAGYSTIQVSVLEVGPELVGEQATMIVEPPISFKSTAPGYGFLWWFMFWPLYAVLLAFYAAILCRMSVRFKAPTADSSG